MAIAVVTGASGFLGRAFVQELEQRGYEVRGVDVRPGPKVTAGDISRSGRWIAVLDGADLVVHTAAIVAETGDLRAFWRVNVEGTRVVLDAAAEAGVGRVLHLSSIVVHGSQFADGVDETGPVRMTGNPYTDTKVAAEHQALMVAAAGRVPVTIVRPGDIYGPHSVPWTVRPVELMKSGMFVLVDGGKGVLSPVYVDDVVAGGIAAAEHPDAVGEVFHLAGARGVPTKEFFGHYAAWLGVGLRSLPRSAATALVAPLELIARGLGRTSPVSPRAFEYVTHPGAYSIEKARRVLGWQPQVDLEDGMARTREWLEEVGLIPPRDPPRD